MVNFPGDDFPGFGPGAAGLVVDSAEVLPRNRLFRRGGADRQAPHRRFATAGWRRRRWRSFGVEPGHKAVFHFVRIAQNVPLVEVQYIREIVHPCHVTVYNPRFNDMLPLPPKEFLVEYFLQHRRAHFHRRFQGLAVGRIFDCYSVDEALGVIGLMQG